MKTFWLLSGKCREINGATLHDILYWSFVGKFPALWLIELVYLTLEKDWSSKMNLSNHTEMGFHTQQIGQV